MGTAFNTRIKEYPNGHKQVTLYRKPINLSDIEEKDEYDPIMSVQRDIYYDVDNEKRKLITRIYERKLKETLTEDKKPTTTLLRCCEMDDLEYSEYLRKWKKNKLNNKLKNDKRDKQKVYDLARANVWEWFATFTFDPLRTNRQDYDECCKRFTQWLNNIKKRYASDLKYLAVPELHEDGVSWHFHALLANCENLHFIRAINNKKDSKYYGLPLVDKNGNEVYNMQEAFTLGNCSFTKVRSTEKVSRYITKYITKETELKITGRNRHLASRNLAKPTVSKELLFPEDIETLIESVNIEWECTKKVMTNTEFENEIRILEIT